MGRHFLPSLFLFVLSFYSLSVNGKYLAKQGDEFTQFELPGDDDQEPVKTTRKPGTHKPFLPFYDQQQGQQNSKYFDGRKENGKGSDDITFNNDRFEDGIRKTGQQPTWRGKEYEERTTTYSPPKGGYSNNNYNGNHKQPLPTTTTKKPWYIRFKNWTNDKFKQIG